MRRKDREVTDIEKIKSIIDRCDCCRIGFYDEGEVYIIPLNFGWEQREDGSFVLYFHGAQKGRKIDLLASAPTVGFEMDTDYQLKPAETACDYTARFCSVIGNGTASLMEDAEEKRHALAMLMKHTTGRENWDFPERMLRAVAVFKVEVTALSCKEHE